LLLKKVFLSKAGAKIWIVFLPCKQNSEKNQLFFDQNPGQAFKNKIISRLKDGKK